jgi:hypothetical protein
VSFIPTSAGEQLLHLGDLIRPPSSQFTPLYQVWMVSPSLRAEETRAMTIGGFSTFFPIMEVAGSGTPSEFPVLAVDSRTSAVILPH